MALAVVWSHSFALALPEGERAEPVSRITNGHYSAGSIAVMVFFTISGYLICQSWMSSRDLRSFLEKRVRRIYPGYMAATSICAFVVVPAFSTVYDLSPYTIAKTISSNLLLRNFFPPSTAFAHNLNTAVNGSLWSIPFEFWCYIFTAALGLLGLLRSARAVIAIIAVTLLARAAFDLFDRKPGWGAIGYIFGWPYLWTFVLPCFLSGALVFLLKDRIPRHLAILVALVTAFFAACYAPLGAKFQQIASQLIFPAAVAYSTFYLAFSDRIRLRNAACYGDLSYGTYLYAFPIQQALISANLFSLPEVVLLSAALSILAGALSWHLVEKHFLSRSKLARRQLHPAITT